ncbi:hypothetical protein LCGC14_2248490 [marine sediment metagenome]|uniref:Uncharacterized protein n=1 Tax=marine sediment metagenome TaxID=412755 RepID=A0A0F9DQQ9_9ZZZZ
MKKVLKKFPKGTDLRYADWDHFAIWGDWMARVDRPHISLYSSDDFDAELQARRYVVYLTDIPADPKLLGVGFSFKYGNRSIYEQPFYYRPRPTWMRADTGHMKEPVDYWVIVKKFSDLSDSEDSAVLRLLEEKNYIEIRKYHLTKTKWAKLLTMSFPATQDLEDYEMGNAADEAVGAVAWNQNRERSYETYSEQPFWDQIPGVYTTTRKGRIKWVISRKPSKKGL